MNFYLITLTLASGEQIVRKLRAKSGDAAVRATGLDAYVDEGAILVLEEVVI